jgi:NAD(P)-dependent dehydrogenase (short-subunit alcohol dehydrogenase family)
MSNLAGEIAFVTGAASGIGRASAQALAEAGATVVAADVDANGARATVKRIREAGGDAEALRCDVSDEDDVRHAIERIVDEHGRLDIAHNNAGIEGPLAKLPDVDEADFDDVIDVNLKGVFLGLKHQIPVMAENGGGAIVNTSSVAGLRANQGAAPYSASKHGVVGLTKTAAAEWAREGVRVNAVCPGWTQTPMVERTDEKNPRVREAFEARVPANRVAEPEEVAALVVFLAGDEAAYLNGAAVPIDGGWTAV